MINYDVINKYIVIDNSFNSRPTASLLSGSNFNLHPRMDRPKLGLISDMIHGECREQTIKDIWLQHAYYRNIHIQ